VIDLKSKDKKVISKSGEKPDKVALSQAKGYENEIITDPFGSYTGVPVDDPYDKPVQDADDL
jgi:hypothetical protein